MYLSIHLLREVAYHNFVCVPHTHTNINKSKSLIFYTQIKIVVLTFHRLWELSKLWIWFRRWLLISFRSLWQWVYTASEGLHRQDLDPRSFRKRRYTSAPVNKARSCISTGCVTLLWQHTWLWIAIHFCCHFIFLYSVIEGKISIK